MVKEITAFIMLCIALKFYYDYLDRKNKRKNNN